MEDTAAPREGDAGVGWGGGAMENTLLIGLSRQMSLSRELDVVANNIANLNTHRVQERHGHLPRIPDADRPRRPVCPQGQPSQLRGGDGATWQDFSQGPSSSRPATPSILAIDGDAFLTVQTRGPARGLHAQRLPADPRHRSNSVTERTATPKLPRSAASALFVFSPSTAIYQLSHRTVSVTVREGASTPPDAVPRQAAA